MESEKDMLSRLKGMAAGDATWDLSTNDTNAIKWALKLVEEKLTASNKQSTPLHDCSVCQDTNCKDHGKTDRRCCFEG